MASPAARSQARMPTDPSSSSPRPLSSSIRNAIASPLRPSSRGSVGGYHSSSLRDSESMIGGMGRLGLGPAEETFPMLKQWTSHSYEWTVRDLGRLNRDVESKKQQVNEVEEAELHEFLRTRFVMTGGHFRVEVAVNPSAQSDPNVSPDPSQTADASSASGASAAPQAVHDGSISIYIALVTPERIPADYAVSTSIFIGIKPLGEGVGRRDGRQRWVWSESEEITFHRDVEYWECVMPELEVLQANTDVADGDGFVLVLQFSSPATASPMQRVGYQTVPRDVMDGLANSMDNHTTGDVRLVCLEYQDAAESNSEVSVAPSSPLQSTSPVGLHRVRSASTSVAPDLRYRKRVIYAHSDILRARSEYFRDILSPHFSEGQGITPPGLSPGHGKAPQRFTVHCNSDFVTVWWLLHWIYLNELDFAKMDDIRTLVARRDSVANISHTTQGGLRDWDWKPISTAASLTSPDDREDARTVKSGVSAASHGSAALSQAPPSSVNQAGQSAKAGVPTAASRTRPTRTASKAGQTESEGIRQRPTVSSSATTSRRNPGKVPSPSRTGLTLPSNAIAAPYPLHFHPASRMSTMPAQDPHTHPAPAPEPASALAVYFLSHQYGLQTLQHLAQEHIMSTLTPETAMPTLLASFNYDDLHHAVLDFVVDCWPAVQAEREFLQCIKEVSGGLWGGETGALVLHSLFRRL